MRVLACVLALAAANTAAAAPQAGCPHMAGSLSYDRGGKTHVVALATCVERISRAAAPVPRRAPVPGVTARGPTPGLQRLYFQGRLVYAHAETGPFVPLKLSSDGRWLFFFVDEYGAQSAIADGVPLLVVSTRGGPVHGLGTMLPYADYLTWCGGEIVYTPGFDRVAIHGKRLLTAAPPDWRPHSLWDDPRRTFSTPACEPRHAAVAVLTQHTSADAKFFATRWRLWRVALNGSRRPIDTPPPGWADEQPTWSSDGNALLFVRERNGYGRIMLHARQRLFGPLGDLGYSPGYYGHHVWRMRWR